MKSLDVTQKQAVQLNMHISMLKQDMNNVTLNTYISRVKKLSLQSLDLFNEMHRQISFLNNEDKNVELRKRMRQEKEEQEKMKQERENKRRTK